MSYGTGDHNPVSVAVADLNGDGRPDIVVINQFTGADFASGGSTAAVLLGNGDGTFQPAVTYDSGGSFAYSVAIGDFDGDGKPDLAVVNGCVDLGGFNCSQEGLVGILIGNGDGTFQPARTYGSGGLGFFRSQIAIADVNRDGTPDLLVTSCWPVGGGSICSRGTEGIVGVLLGNGDGSFQEAVTYGSGDGAAYAIAVSDVNGDGSPDLLVANLGCAGTDDGCVAVLLGKGDGTFRPAATYGSGGQFATSIAAADVNHDGKPDLVVSNCGPEACGAFRSFPGSLGVLLGNGDGHFQPVVSYGTGGSAYSVAIADVDGDGDLDLVTVNYGAGTVAILPGNGARHGPGR